MYKCILQIGSDTYDVTDGVRNWDDIQASFKRDGYGGVVRSFTSKFEFVGDARQHILDEFDTNYLKAKARITISTRNDEWEYDERFSCDLDFTTIEDDWHTLSINAVDNDIASIIKAKKGTEYEYVISEIKEDAQLEYDGIEIKETTQWQPTSNTDEETAEADRVKVRLSSVEKYFPLYSTSDEINIGGKFVTADQSEYAENYFIETVGGGYLSLLFNFDIRMAKSTNSLSSIYGVKFSLVLIPNGGGEEQVIRSFEMRPESSYPNYETVSHKENYSAYFFSCRLALKAVLIYEFNDGDVQKVEQDMDVYTTSFVKASWNNRISPVKIDLVSPTTLLNRLLKSMNGGEDGITGEITASERTSKAMLCASESIRGIDGAKMYSSFTKFCEWMEAVFGYIYEIQGQKVVFKSRQSCFAGEITKHVYEYADYEMSLSEDLIFSRVVAGYDRQDYDSVNGRDEFNFTNQYTTGVLNSDKSLSLKSPYRADSFGIEFLVEKRGEDTTDNESDKDLFFVGVNLSGGKYTLDRSVTLSGVNSPSSMFNAMFSPSSIIEANKGYIGASTDNLTFASSDGNAEVTIGGKKENRDMAVESSLFNAREVKFETSDIEIPENLNGMIVLHASSGDITGFLKNVDYTYTKRKSATFTLIQK